MMESFRRFLAKRPDASRLGGIVAGGIDDNADDSCAWDRDRDNSSDGAGDLKYTAIARNARLYASS